MTVVEKADFDTMALSKERLSEDIVPTSYRFAGVQDLSVRFGVVRLTGYEEMNPKNVLFN